MVSVADQVHQHAPQSVATAQVHVAGLRQLPGGALEQQDKVLAALGTGDAEGFAAVDQQHFVRRDGAAVLVLLEVTDAGDLQDQHSRSVADIECLAQVA